MSFGCHTQLLEGKRWTEDDDMVLNNINELSILCMEYNIWPNDDLWEVRCTKRASVREGGDNPFLCSLPIWMRFDLCAHLICQRLHWIQSGVLWQRRWRHKWFKNYIKHVNERHNSSSSFFFLKWARWFEAIESHAQTCLSDEIY